MLWPESLRRSGIAPNWSRILGAFEPIERGSRRGEIGERVVGVRELCPEGLVRVRGEIWRARACDGHAPVAKGGLVTVVEREGLVLTVEPGENSGR